MEDLNIWTNWECEMFRRNSSYDFVNVVCIEHDEHGIASRKALGRVTLKDWHREASKDEVEVFLQ